MTHSLIKSNGTIVELNDNSINELSTEARLKFEAIRDFDKFTTSESPKVFNLVEPSNTTLLYLATELCKCIDAACKDSFYIDPVVVNRLIISQDEPLDPYIYIANQCIEKVNPKSDKFAYKGDKGIISKYEAQNDLFSRFQVIMESILYHYFNHTPISVVVGDKFDVPYMLNCYANILVWTKEQYDELKASLKTERSDTEK